MDVKDRSSSLNPWQTRENYRKRMHDLLWTEEAQQKKLIRQYDRHKVKIDVRSPSSASPPSLLTLPLQSP